MKVYVSKKLAKTQAELNNIVETLGGDFFWIYNQSCTHFIYSGKANDSNKELRLAKEQNKIIVSPYWLYACQEQKQRADETQYPYTYNPSKCAVVTSRTPKVSIAGDKAQGLSTPNVARQQLSSQQVPRSQVKKTTTQNIIKNYCSDEEDEDDNEDENLLAAANYRLLKKKPPLSVPPEAENDSEMNLIDSQFMRNCDKQCKNALTSAASDNANDIPDSIDIKNDFLNQLQDKLANIRTTSNNSVSSMTVGNNNLNTSQTTMLNEYQIMNELNKSGRSKWGNSINNDLDENKTLDAKQDDDDLFCVRILDDNNPGDNDDENSSDMDKLRQLNLNSNNSNSNKKQQQKYKNDKKRRQFSKVGDDDDDELDGLNERNHHVAQSQIQMTLWKDEHQQTNRRKNENISDRFSNYYKN